MTANYISLRVLAIVFFNFASSTATPMLFAIADLYEVGADGKAMELLVTDGVQWKRTVNLKKLEILTNDVVLSLPHESCLEDKLTRQKRYGDNAEQKSKFEEIHQVMFSFVTFMS